MAAAGYGGEEGCRCSGHEGRGGDECRKDGQLAGDFSATFAEAFVGGIGGAEAARWLAALDPAAAARIDPRNVRRVVRALEVTLVSGRPISELQGKTPPPYDVRIVGLHRDRAALYARIDTRVAEMMAAGLLDEVRRLIERNGHSTGSSPSRIVAELAAIPDTEPLAALRDAAEAEADTAQTRKTELECALGQAVTERDAAW